MSEKFKELLNEKHEFPCFYKFKFIVKADFVDQVTNYFPKDVPDLKYSSNQKYCSVSISKKVKDADEVLLIYSDLSKIKGIISL